jgi:hypothetical protein
MSEVEEYRKAKDEYFQDDPRSPLTRSNGEAVLIYGGCVMAPRVRDSIVCAGVCKLLGGRASLRKWRKECFEIERRRRR